VNDDENLSPVPPVTVEEPSGPAVGSLVWGLVTLAVAGLVGLHELTDLRVDLSLALPIGMVVLGVLLVVGAVVTGLRRRGDVRTDDHGSGGDGPVPR
jgi:hypothetical protein